MSKSHSKKAIGIFLILTLALSAGVWILTIHSGEGRIGGRIYGYGIMWCPALATWLTCKILKIKIGDLAWQWGKAKYLVWAYITPLAFSMIAYLIIWFTGWGGFYNKEFVTEAAKSLGWSNLSPGVFIAVFFVVNGVIGIFGGMSTALGEEIGWRGFLVPHLNKITNYTYTSLISGLIWGLWHYPLIIWGHYNGGTPIWYGLTCFTIAIVSEGFIYTWFRLKSGSLWTGVMLHASHNLFVQSFFTPITIVTNSKTNYFIDEFGAVLAVITMFGAIYFWSRRNEVENLQYK